jgi:hypothetical protein
MPLDDPIEAGARCIIVRAISANPASIGDLRDQSTQDFVRWARRNRTAVMAAARAWSHKGPPRGEDVQNYQRVRRAAQVRLVRRWLKGA